MWQLRPNAWDLRWPPDKSTGSARATRQEEYLAGTRDAEPCLKEQGVA